MKITKRQLRRIIKEESARLLRENFSIGNIDASQGTDFTLADESGDLYVEGNLLDSEALRELANVLDDITSEAPSVTPEGYVSFSID